ncbi:SDR family oxidoreductase [Aureimonas sp. ME7]|uniref:SDR family oxidoreductase n=1 Tax=Aureimonas sp. ME7 TaxID=2744252 RepID=UPI0015F55B8B|nr:SDR family oxidoreductase [Aureimonas sp. ME7]
MSEIPAKPRIAVLGASGLIGEMLCTELSREGHEVVPVARSFTQRQLAAFEGRAVLFPLVDADAPGLAAEFIRIAPDLVVNCVGVLQDTAGSAAADVHEGFVSRLLGAMEELAPALLVHVSVPGDAAEDRTSFSRTKRAGEAAIARSAIAHAILRPGFVLTHVPYGGSALMRALATLPVALPEALAERPFAVTDGRDIARTVAFLAAEWRAGRRDFRQTWDVMEREASSVGTVLQALRHQLGGPAPRLPAPGRLLDWAGRAGDLASRLGWRPPVRSTAIAEMRRGVRGDPSAWMRATGLVPLPGPAVVGRLGSGVQDLWFARLYLLKALVIATLALFWIVSGAIAISVAFDAASGILVDHGFSRPLADAVTVLTSLMDISIGVLIAHRRSCRLGLAAGVALSLFYMAMAAVVTPAMWVEPLGALVKTGPAIVLMIVAFATWEDR